MRTPSGVTHKPTHLWFASDRTVEGGAVTSHHHAVCQRRQELGGRPEVMLLVLERFQADIWGRGGASMRRLTWLAPLSPTFPLPGTIDLEFAGEGVVQSGHSQIPAPAQVGGGT